MFYVYILENTNTGKKYIGQTKDLAKRLYKHNTNSNKYTRHKGSWKLVHSEGCSTRIEAIKKERFLKTGKGREFIKEVLRGVA